MFHHDRGGPHGRGGARRARQLRGAERRRAAGDQRTTLRYVSCLRSPWGDLLFKLNSMNYVEYLNTAQLCIFKGFHFKRKSPHGGSQAGDMSQAACPRRASRSAWRAAPGPSRRRGRCSRSSCRTRQTHTCIYIYIYTYMLYIYIYIYICCISIYSCTCI